MDSNWLLFYSNEPRGRKKLEGNRFNLHFESLKDLMLVRNWIDQMLSLPYSLPSPSLTPPPTSYAKQEIFVGRNDDSIFQLSLFCLAI